MILLPALLYFSAVVAHTQDRLRKVSGDAAPEKAQEPLEEYENFVHTIDSSVSMDDSIPQPPAFSFSLPTLPDHTEKPRPPSSRPVAPPATAADAVEGIVQSTLMPPPSTSSDNNQTTITMTPYDGVHNTIDIEDILPEPVDDLVEFQKADLLEREKEAAEVKDLVRKNKTSDYYITSSPFSPTNTLSSERDSDEGEGNDVVDFNKLFDRKSTLMENNTTTTSGGQKKTCIEEAVALKKIDRDAPGTKKGTLEVSVEVGEDQDEDEEDDSEEQEEEEPPVRKAREQERKKEDLKKMEMKKMEAKKKSVVWKKFEMNCDEEEDEKGKICKLWALGGLCSTHRPTMFLFCRKTCLCVGPS